MLTRANVNNLVNFLLKMEKKMTITSRFAPENQDAYECFFLLLWICKYKETVVLVYIVPKGTLPGLYTLS